MAEPIPQTHKTDPHADPRRCYRIGNYVINGDARTLFQDGALVHTTDKMIVLLQALLKNPGSVVGKYDLLEILWPNQEVSEWSLSRLVSDTRQAMGEEARELRLIQTVRGQGFRLNPDVTVHLTEMAATPRLTPTRSRGYKKAIGVALVSLTVAAYLIGNRQYGTAGMPDMGDERRLVVLPVNIETGDDQDSWAEYGVMTMLAGQLGRFPELQVADVETTISALDQIALDTSTQDSATLFQEVCVPLGCRQLIAARLALSASGVPELTYALHTENGISPAYSFANEDILQSSTSLFEHVLVRLLPPQPERISMEGLYTDDPKVNQNFALGASSVLRGDSQSAIRYLSMALELKPDYFWGRAYLSDALIRTGDFERAETILDELAVVATDQRQLLHLAKLRSGVSFARGNLKDSLTDTAEMMRLAIELNDKEAEGVAVMHMGTTSQSLGKNLQAIDYLKMALALFRQHGFELHESKTTFNLGNAYYVLDDHEQAEQYYVAAADMFRRQGANEWLSYVQYALAAMRMTQGRLDLAEAEFRELEKRYRSTGEVEGLLLVRGELGTLELRRGNPRQAEPLLVEAYEGAGDRFRYVRSWMSGLLAICYLNMGEPDKARPFVEERKRFDWFEPRVPMVFIAASLAHAEGDYAGAVNKAREAQDRVGGEWSARHDEWLLAFQESARQGQPLSSDYFHFGLDSTP